MKNNRPLSEAISLSVTEAALYVRSSRGYIYDLIRAGAVTWFYRGSRKRILRQSLEEAEARLAAEAEDLKRRECPLCGRKSRTASDISLWDRDHPQR